jgi:acetylornithine deacetylase/succinyl-diaminopimelate desuccinylase-like protein
MKGGLAMMLAALLRTQAQKGRPRGDIVFAALADEETGGDAGARYVVDSHAEHFSQVKYAISEFGGFSHVSRGQTLYPIMVAEKQMCWLQATVRGPGGHGSMPVRGGAMAKAAQFLQRLDRNRLPVHITPAARLMFEGMAEAIGGISGLAVRQLLRPRLTDHLLDLMGAQGKLFDPLLHNTAGATMLKASEKINVTPGEVQIGIDGRLLPGQRAEDLVKELRALVGPDPELAVVRTVPPPPEPDMGLFGTLSSVLAELDPAGKPVPYMLAAATDSVHFSRLGIHTYGFLPMRLPPDFKFTSVVHAADERIPVDALNFGADAITRLLQRV